MRIYLAGKIASVDWRHMIVRGLTEKLKGPELATAWPIMEGSIYSIHDYTGPYFATIDKTVEARPAKVHRLCLEAVDNSDLIYAWVDDETCYATIYEMGYAVAKGKYTAVAYPPDFDKSELWFMSACSDEIIEAKTPELGLLASTMRALKSGKLKNPVAELERVEKNMARLQQSLLGDVHEAIGRDQGSGRGDNTGSVGQAVGEALEEGSFEEEPPTNPQDINSKKKSGNYPAVRPEEKEGNGDE